jgi:hypothetical protein
MLTSLGDVTQTLKNLIRDALLFDGVLASQFSVSALPPDTDFGVKTVVSVHLFHVIESPEFKNRVSASALGPIPIQHAPMGLILQYAITVFTPAVTDPELDSAALAHQRFIGVISRALHDFPIITEKTTVDGTNFVLDTNLEGQNARIEVILRPAAMEETLNFWSTEDKRVPRLMLFAEARVIVLEPKPPVVAPGIVLSVGQFVFTSSEPQLVATRNEVWFVPPGPIPQIRAVRASPARAALFDQLGSSALADLVASASSPNILENNRLFIDGSGLAPGRRFLLLRRGATTSKIALDQRAAEQPADNVQWAFSVSGNEVSLRVFSKVRDTANAPIAILPGLFGVRLLIEDDRAGDAVRPRTSNELAFMVTPQILSVTVTASRTYALVIVGDYLVPADPSDVAPREIELSVAGAVLTRRTAAGAPGAGEFRVVDAGADNGKRIDFVLPTATTDPTDASPLAVRLLVNGATATPAWISRATP